MVKMIIVQDSELIMKISKEKILHLISSLLKQQQIQLKIIIGNLIFHQLN